MSSKVVRKETTVEMREVIVKLRKEGKSYAEIGKLTGKPRSTIQTIIRNAENRNATDSLPRSGRPRKLSERDRRMVLHEINKNPKTSAVELNNMVYRTTGTIVNPETIRIMLREEGFKSRSPRKKPFISAVNREKRLTFARLHVDKTVEFWDRVIFTDESKFNLFGSDGKTRVWRKINTAMVEKNLIRTVKYGGGSVMVWGCMSTAGVGNLVFIEGKMDRYAYLNILRGNLKQSAENLGHQQSWIFQQDNDPKHTALVVREWLLYNTPKQLHSPPQSPDLNPIEHLWDELERRVRKLSCSTKEELKSALLQAWRNIPSEVLKNLVHSMPNRIRACIDAKGGPTKY